MQIKNILPIFLLPFFAPCFILLLPQNVFAAFRWEIQYPWEAPQPGNLPEYILYIYRFAIFSSGIVALLMLVIGGIFYMTSGENPEKKKDAKDRIFSALGGLVLVFLIYIILNTLNPELTRISPPSLRPNPDKICQEFCHQSCEEKCSDSATILKCKDFWDKSKVVINGELQCVGKPPEQEKKIEPICQESCLITCSQICSFACAKNYWEGKCEDSWKDSGAQELLCQTQCSIRAPSLAAIACNWSCSEKEAGIVGCSGCCQKGILPLMIIQIGSSESGKICTDSCIEASNNTCERFSS
jgi:hypothetical protein